MAHHHNYLAQDSAAIFSPSVARIAASDARDWSYVDSWLASKFSDRSVPPFERTPDTLKALLALATLNESADEERQLVSRAENDALGQIHCFQGESAGDDDNLKEKLLEALEDELSPEGQVALNSIASMAVRAGIAFPEPADLGNKLLGLHKSVQETEQMRERVEILQHYVESDMDRLNGFLRSLDSDDYKPPLELAKQNLEMQRKVKMLSAQLPELQDRVANVASSVGQPHITIDVIAREEREYLALLSQKKHLDQQMAAFAGLPSDPDLAREELDSLRQQLHGATSHRDAVFEGLVERESPVRKRR